MLATGSRTPGNGAGRFRRAQHQCLLGSTINVAIRYTPRMPEFRLQRTVAVTCGLMHVSME